MVKNAIISALASILVYNAGFWIDNDPLMLVWMFIIAFFSITYAECAAEEYLLKKR